MGEETCFIHKDDPVVKDLFATKPWEVDGMMAWFQLFGPFSRNPHNVRPNRWWWLSISPLSWNGEMHYFVL